MELTKAQKEERPRHGRGKRLEVARDDVWWAEHRCKTITAGAHPSHALFKVGQYHFCTACGHHGAHKLMALADPCPRTATPSRRFLLKRMQAGLHPRSGEPLGEVVRVERAIGSGEMGLSATRRSRL